MTSQMRNPTTGMLDTVGMRVVPFAGIPKLTDYGYNLGTFGRNEATGDFYILRDNSTNAADWQNIASSALDFYEDVLSIADASVAPPTEVVGSRYILDTSAPVHADWDGAVAQDVVDYNGATWIATTPSSGGFVYVKDVTTLYVFTSGAWNDITAAIPDATTTTKGVVSVDAYDFNISSGALSQRPGSGVYFVGKWGNDSADGLTFSSAKLTVQSAVTAAPANATILLYPGTYTETVTHTASNITVIGMGKPNSVILTQADANVVNFSTYTGIQYKELTVQCTAATTAINTVQGTTGICAFKECKLAMTSSADIAASAQPAVGAITGAGTLKVILGQVSYKNTGNGGGTALKGAFKVEDGGVINLSLVKGITIENSGTALVSSIGIDTSSTGYFVLNENDIDVTDSNATVVAGLAYLGGTGVDHEYRRNTVHVTVGANAGYGIFTADTASMTRSFYNHIHVVDTGGSSYGFLVGAGSELISQFDDVIADDGNTISGTFTQVNSPSDGDLTASGTIEATTFDTNVAAAAVTLSGTSLVADGTDADIDISITPKGTGSAVISKADIDGGTIDGATIATSNITVGAGKTLDVSAGTLTLADNQISGDKVEGGTIAATTITELTSTTVKATTFDTNVDAAGVTLSGTSLTADGTDADIDISITPKGTGSAVISKADINGGTIDGTVITSDNYNIDATPASDTTASGIKVSFTANENQTFGDLVYIGTSSEAYIADASVIGTARVVAMCADATISADATGNYLLMGIARQDTWTWSAPGVPIYLTIDGTTGNCLSETAPLATAECVVIVGTALTADSMIFNPNNAIVEIS